MANQIGIFYIENGFGEKLFYEPDKKYFFKEGTNGFAYFHSQQEAHDLINNNNLFGAIVKPLL